MDNHIQPTHMCAAMQVLQHRGRKNIQLEDVKIHVCVFAFDLLYLNGESLLREPLVNRRARLHESFNVVPTEFTFATYSDGRDPEVIESFLQESIRENCEGLMVKTLKVLPWKPKPWNLIPQCG